MQVYKKKSNNNGTTKSIDNKNIKSSLFTKDKLNVGTIRKNYLLNLKRELNNKINEDSNFISKKSRHYLKQKSIDNTRQKYLLYNISSSINNNDTFFKNQIRPIKYSNQIIKQNNNNILKNATMKNQAKRHQRSIDNKNIKNINIKKSLKNQSTNNSSLQYSYNNNPNKQIANDLNSDSKDTLYENEIVKYNNKNIITTFVQIDDLTKIPVRIGGIQNKYADYDFNEAKRAAVTCRRIEYSYNLRNVIKSEICLDEVIMIQRWWRKILQRKNRKILKELRIFEKLNINNIQRYILFLNKIHYVYVLHLLNEFINKFKIRYGKLYYKNYFNKYAIKIQRAFREFSAKRKSEGISKLRPILNKYIYKYKKAELFEEIRNIPIIINKIILLQNFVKYYLLRRKEDYLLKCAHEIHPFIYYLLKYRIPKNIQKNRKYKRKTKRFLTIIEKWKKLTKYKRMVKYMMFSENIKFIIKKKFFIFFILRLVERINAMITYFLLQPLMKNILRVYYRKKIKKVFLVWKKNDKIRKKRNQLAMNLITKTIKIFTINSFKKKLKKNNQFG